MSLPKTLRINDFSKILEGKWIKNRGFLQEQVSGKVGRIDISKRIIRVVLENPKIIKSQN